MQILYSLMTGLVLATILYLIIYLEVKVCISNAIRTLDKQIAINTILILRTQHDIEEMRIRVSLLDTEGKDND